MKRYSLVGQKFGRWTVIEFAFIKAGHSYWKCLCKCGNKKNILGGSLKNNQSKSCGCFLKEKNRKIQLTHGMSKTRFYCIWNSMKQRCVNKNNDNYKHYGGRGITICKEWMKFENFRDDMYQFYLSNIKKFGEKNTTLDRKNNMGNYCLKNCRWSDMDVQANNKRNTHLITFDNKTMTISQWAKYLNINRIALGNKISRKCPLQDVLNPQNYFKEHILYNGKTMTIKEWAKEINISYGTLYERIKYLNWSIDRALTTKPRKRKS